MKTSAEKLNIHFVKMVETNPCIWDTSSKDYRNKKLLKSAWHKISKEINEPVDSCPERWRKIRDALFRSIKRHSMKKGNRRTKPYYLTPHLHFLLPFPTISKKYNHNQSTIELRDESEDSKPGPFLDEIQINDATESFPNDNELESISSTIPPIRDKSPIKNDIEECGNNDQFFEMIDEAEPFMSKPRSRKQNEEEENQDDSDMNFFKSLLRDVRKMDDRQNRKFRLRVLQVIEEIFDQNIGEESFDHQRKKRK
ncbi:transcription factor Adf-1-like [Eupeodes corollae]|uniref:transcription factor Adf-1-like n=1 Tax=Eupeodes corollae TaxID=290404 RepID=UPI00249362AE|nr:transcription factor Adf-1-like [Eupeodes corollae]